MTRTTVAIIVTYGNRAELCLRVIEAAFGNGVDQALVIDNGSPEENAAKLRFAAANDARIVLLRQDENLGSAGGIARGLERAIDLRPEYIWFLDDDNLPNADCLARLLCTQSAMSSVFPEAVLYCYRGSTRIDDLHAIIPLLPEMYDEPFADSSQIPTHLVCKAARTNVTVALSGDAGDELFGGYNRYFWGPRIWKRLDWMPHPLRHGLGQAIAAVPVAAWDRIGTMTGGRVTRPGDKAHRLAARLRDVRTMDDLYRSLVSEWPGESMVIGLRGEPSSLLDDPLPAALADDASARMMAQDMRSYLPDDILCKVDRAAMAVSLETRVPFLDPDVLAASARLPSQIKIRDGQGKWALRQILYRHVPRELIERPKTGFGIPVGDWLRGPLRGWAEDLLSEENLRRDGLIDPAPVREAWAEHLSSRRDWTHRLWIVLMLMAWRARVA